MSSMVSSKSFTNTLIVLCLLLLFQAIIPDSFPKIGFFLKYVTIIMTVILLMMHNKMLNITNDLEKNQNQELKSINPKETAADSYNSLTSLVLDTIQKINPNSKSAIFIADPQKNCFFLQKGSDSEFSENISTENISIRKLIFEKKKLHQKEQPDLWGEIFLGNNWRGSECAIFNPINLYDNTVGFILTRFDHFNDATEDEMNLYGPLAQFVSMSLDTLESLDKHRIGEDTKSFILDILSNSDFKSDSQKIFNQFKYLIRTFFKYDRMTMSLKKESENRRKYDKGVVSIIKLCDGEKDEFNEGSDFPTNSSLHGLPIVTGSSFMTNDWKQSYQNLFRFKSSESSEYQFKSVVGVPIIIEDESRGSIILESKEKSTHSDLNLDDLSLIGQVMGTALHWRYEYEKIHNNATHDGLSGLLNHQTFKERFNDEIQRAARFQQKMAVMMFDLDKFKKVNDTLGHQYGDYVIQTVAKIMIDNVRAVDVVARYGGEEFAIILINTTAEMSNIVAQRIVDNIADYKFSFEGVDTRLSISGGMAEYPTHSDNIRQLIEIADQEMYATKQRGGNGITIHDKEIKTND